MTVATNWGWDTRSQAYDQMAKALEALADQQHSQGQEGMASFTLIEAQAMRQIEELSRSAATSTQKPS